MWNDELGLRPKRTLSNTKNSSSGPKKALSAMPEAVRWASALVAT